MAPAFHPDVERLDEPDLERWFKELIDRRLRRGVFTSVAELEEAILLWADHWNDDPKPFVWKATPADIIEKSSEAGPP